MAFPLEGGIASSLGDELEWGEVEGKSMTLSSFDVDVDCVATGDPLILSIHRGAYL